MPIYEFLCRDCEHRFDDLVSMDDDTAQTCTECRSGDVVKLYSPFSVSKKSDAGVPMPAGACMPGPAGASRGGGCCGGGCGGC